MALCNKINPRYLIATFSPVKRATLIQLTERAISATPALKTRTHTGQEFAEDDYRTVRFESKKKLVNDKFAIDLVSQVPPTETESRVVWCDGGSGPTGHPRVYINLDQPGNHCCKYCGLRFYKDGSHH